MRTGRWRKCCLKNRGTTSASAMPLSIVWPIFRQYLFEQKHLTNDYPNFLNKKRLCSEACGKDKIITISRTVDRNMENSQQKQQPWLLDPTPKRFFCGLPGGSACCEQHPTHGPFRGGDTWRIMATWKRGGSNFFVVGHHRDFPDLLSKWIYKAEQKQQQSWNEGEEN